MRLVPLLVIAALWPCRVGAQVAFDECRDRTDQPIPVFTDNSIAYAGVATFRNGRPVILWNARTNRYLSATERHFLYLHECAHHVLDHPYRGDVGLAEEQAADCWAIQLMVEGNMIRPRQLRELEQTREAVRGDDTHLGGEAHVRSLQECLKRRKNPSIWAAALDTLVAAARQDFATRRGRMLDSSGVTPVYEALVDVPETYDCEVIGEALRCVFFSARKSRAAAGRYRTLTRMLESWLPRRWTSAEQVSTDPDRRRVWVARDLDTHTLLTLTLARTQVYLFCKRLRV
jgi:hypothetical protein